MIAGRLRPSPGTSLPVGPAMNRADGLPAINNAPIVVSLSGASRFDPPGSPEYERFTEGFDTLDLKEARDLLDDLRS
jgi:hypothetical protein